VFFLPIANCLQYGWGMNRLPLDPALTAIMGMAVASFSRMQSAGRIAVMTKEAAGIFALEFSIQ
jgi:hypothetical protein